MDKFVTTFRSTIAFAVGASLLTAIAGAQTAAANASATQSQKFTLELLGELGSDESAHVAGINDAGDAAGSVGVYVNGQPSPACPVECAVIWRHGEPRVLETDANYGSQAYAINNSGQIVGVFFPDDSPENSSAVVWNNGSPTVLPSPGPQYTEITTDSISDTGLIVGNAVANGAYAAIEWNGLTPTLLGSPPGCTGSALANSVNDDGIAVGVTYCPASGQIDNGMATAWNGTVPMPLKGAGGFNPEAYAINNAGLIVGISVYGATAWVNGALRPLGGAKATAVNSLGVIVGKARYAGNYHASVWNSVGDAPQDLNTLVGTVAFREYVMTEATGINGSCTIVANGYRRNDPYRTVAFQLTPTDPSNCRNGL